MASESADKTRRALSSDGGGPEASDSLRRTHVDRGLIAPLRRDPEAQPGAALLSGVYFPDGSVVGDSLLVRHGAPLTVAGAFTAEEERDEDVIYAGRLFGHYGHYLLESLARLGPAADHPDRPIVWSMPEGSGQHAYEAWQQNLLALLGLRNPAIFVTRPTRFRSVIVGEPGYRMHDRLHPDHTAFLERAGVAHRPVAGRKLWLSRSKLDSGDGIANVDALERRLRAAGWQIIHPQNLDMRQQLAELSTAERIAGEEGSAFHTLLLIAAPRDLKVDIFRRSNSPLPVSENYATIAAAKGFRQTVHHDPDEVVSARDRARVQKVVPNFNRILDALGTAIEPKGFHTRKANHSARRLIGLAEINGAASYLEIGVANGRTFFNVPVADKTAVDPQFWFDPREYADRTDRFLEITSDDFFLHFAPAGKKYDLMFLDGLHSFEQTFRDFCASQAHAGDDTVWLIDDVVPSDPYSALTDQGKALDLRARFGSEGKGWHGDVFKLVMAVHDFFPNLDFRTFGTGGNHQTVILRRPRSAFRPRFRGIEEISRMTFFDFLDHRDILQELPERKVLDWVRGRIGSVRAAPVGSRAAE